MFRRDAEGPVGGEDPVAVLPVVVRHQPEHGLHIRTRQLPAQGEHLLAHVPVIGPLPLGDGPVMAQRGEAVDVQIPL